MLRLSKLADYGTVVMAHMARQPGRHYSAADVAGATGMSAATASKVLKTLTRSGLLLSLRGARGGYRLARPPEEISLAQVIEAMEGPVAMTECGLAEGLCAQETSCALRGNWLHVNDLIRRELGHLSLADLARPLLPPAGRTTQGQGGRPHGQRAT